MTRKEIDKIKLILILNRELPNEYLDKNHCKTCSHYYPGKCAVKWTSRMLIDIEFEGCGKNRFCFSHDEIK